MNFAHEFRTIRSDLTLDLRDTFAYESKLYGEIPPVLGTIRFKIIAEVTPNGTVALPKPLELIIMRNISGYFIFYNRYHSTNKSQKWQSRGLLAPGNYILLVESDFYKPVEQQIRLPNPTQPYVIDLEPNALYPFSRRSTVMRGIWRAYNGKGKENVTVDLPNDGKTFITDNTGEWIFGFSRELTSRNVSLRITPPENAPVQVITVPLIRGQSTVVLQTSLEGRVQTADGTGIPNIEIVVLTLADTVTTDDEGNWHFYFEQTPPNTVSVIAIKPDGSEQVQNNVPVQPNMIGTVPPFIF
ncbi:MAG: hypothetical protein CL607_21210 [Anaerolineaceae bacterium]|nr:hypothetical protein [Anaerolineaceae bacterium]